MHIIVKEKDSKCINIKIPNFLMNVGLEIAFKCVKFSNCDNFNEVENSLKKIDKKQLKLAIKELKKYKGLEIVSVEEKDGDYVSITI